MKFASFDEDRKKELWSTLALMHTNGLGPTLRKRLVDRYGSPYRAVQAAAGWGSCGLGVRARSVDEFAAGTWRKEARADWECIKKCDAGILLYTDQAYPELLKETSDAPLILFYLGDLSLLQNISMAVVGARDCTTEGIKVAVGIVRELSQAGVTVVSGLARGIDRAAHFAALEGIGSTIAVLGSGIDVPSPRSNEDLYNKVAEQGLILSEFMPGVQAMPGNFPVRNRIISGLSRAVLVVEASVRSGTLITARHALEQNRDVFAVPGSTLAETSEGCRELIRSGAKVIFSAEDILLELAPLVKPAAEGEVRGTSPNDNTAPRKKAEKKRPDSRPQEEKRADSPKPLDAEISGEQVRIISLLQQKGRCHIDEIALQLELDMAAINSALAMLEVQGLISRLPGMQYMIQS